MSSPSPAVPGAQAVDRAARLLRTVVHADEPISFVALLEECGLPKSTTSRLLASLEANQLLERDRDGNYVAGPLFWLYATRHDPWEEMTRLSRPTMELVGRDLRETVALAVARGERVVTVDQVESSYMLGTRDWADTEVPAYASALGKVLYAHGLLTPPTGGLESLTSRTVTSSTRLFAELDEVRRRGWATTIDELEIGLAAVAVPVRGGDGQVCAALGVWGPTARMESRVPEIARLLTERTRQLSQLLRRRNPMNEKQEGIA